VKILVAGAKGMVGSAVVSELEQRGADIVKLSRNEVDLENEKATVEFIADSKVEVIVDAAAKVGGVLSNKQYPVDFLWRNIQIQNNLMKAAHLAGVKRLIFLGCSCIYPRDSVQPIKEEYLLSGPLEPTSSAFSVAKIAGIEMVNSYRKQFGLNWISLIPANVFGPGDNFDILQSHVVPALIGKFDSAKRNGTKKVILWGDGSPMREFLYVSDLASAIIFCLENYNSDTPINIGTGAEISIKDLANCISEQIGFEGKIEWDSRRPMGTPRKILDSSKLTTLGWSPKVSLQEGLAKTIEWHSANEKKWGIGL
jgi:GDP-L-fucose synthase